MRTGDLVKLKDDVGETHKGYIGIVMKIENYDVQVYISQVGLLWRLYRHLEKV
tara:strand:+ start:807 stop:965 length:159 start_codon:yes stop_codon:yes gene_type:complete